MQTQKPLLNRVVYRNYFSRAFAFTLLFALLTDLAYPLKQLTTLGSAAGGGAVADVADGMVDLYTGDFRYSVPLLSVPGPNGENVSLSANYGGGIRMNQSASWIGLGWDLNPGEITRQVVGVPDDFAGQYVVNAETNGVGTTVNPTENVSYYGPVNYNAILNSANAHNPTPQFTTTVGYRVTDFLRTDNGIYNFGGVANTVEQLYNGGLPSYNDYKQLKYFNIGNAPFVMAGYDNYYVSGPGMGGRLKPYIMDGDAMVATSPYTQPNYVSKGFPLKKKMQFLLEQSTKQSYTYNVPNTANNYVRASTFVRYFKNSEINTPANLISSNVSGSPGFIDYKVVPSGQTRRPAPDHDPDAIGGIQVTNAEGLTYHYALPVFARKQLNKQIIPLSPTEPFLQPGTGLSKTNLNYIHDNYAVSWKLTAITGPDYQDKNNNKVVDEGDEGYWVQYKYGMWQPSYLEGTLFNYSRSFKPVSSWTRDFSFRKTYSVQHLELEKYYLDFIRTASHTAYFVKDTRLDNISVENSISTNEKVTPELRLRRIVLLRTDDKALIENAAGWGSSSIHPAFIPGLFSSPNDNSLIHIQNYFSNKSTIDQRSLAAVEFETNYSLCKGYYRNANNGFSTVLVPVQSNAGSTSAPYSSYNYGKTGLFRYINPLAPGFTSTDPANSGKLTLKAIHNYEEGGVSLFNPYRFNYDETNVLKNPNYDPEKTDFWGYYKCDARFGLSNSGYATPLSAQHVDAWSLKTIESPSGSLLTIGYESDVFEREGYTDKPYSSSRVGHLVEGNQSPCLVLPINEVSNFSSKPYSGFPGIHFIYRDAYSLDSAYRLMPGYGTNTTAAGMDRYTVFPVYDYCRVTPSTPIDMLVNYLQVDNMALVAPGTNNASVLPAFYVGNFQRYFDANTNLPVNSSTGLYSFPFDIIKNDCNNWAGCLCPSGTNWWAGYDQTQGMGHMLIRLNRMAGGGTRVKSITVSDPESGSNYKKEFDYEDGYCKVVPRPFMLAPNKKDRILQLWLNADNAIPYLNVNTVGYSKVSTRLVAAGYPDQGKTVYRFDNGTIFNPIRCQGSYSVKTNTGQYCESVGGSNYNKCFQLPEYNYNFDCFVDETALKLQGSLVSQEAQNSDGVVIYEKKLYYAPVQLEEWYNSYVDFENLLLYNKILCFAYVVNGTTLYAQPNSSCGDKEKYHYHFRYKQVSYYPTSVWEKTDGVVTTRQFEYEPVTGFIKKSSGNNAGANLTETIYLFEQAGFSSLGFKADNVANANRLSLTYKTKAYNGTTLLSEGWADNLKSRKSRVRQAPGTGNNTNAYYYSYLNDLAAANAGPPTELDFTETWAKPMNSSVQGAAITAANQKQNTVNVYDTKGHVLEAEGLNGRKAATRYGYNNTLPLAAISNAGYNSFAFSSFEDLINIAPGVMHYGGEVSGGATRSAAFSTATYPAIIKPHSGDYMAKVNGATTGPEVVLTQFDAGRTYVARVWVHASSPASAALRINLTGVSTTNAPLNLTATVSKNDPANVTVGHWVLMSVKLAVPNNVVIPANPKNGSMSLSNEAQLKISLLNTGGSAVACFDDLMVNPVDAPISGTVYDERTLRVKATVNSEGFGSYYYYDAAGRITSAYGESAQYGLKKLSETEYNNCKSFLMALPNAGNNAGGTQ